MSNHEVMVLFWVVVGVVVNHQDRIEIIYFQVTANKWFLPLNWASDILKVALQEDMIPKQCIGGLETTGKYHTD